MRAPSMGEVMAESILEIHITGGRRFWFRLWLGTIFLRLAARIIGCGIEFKGPAQPGPSRPMPKPPGIWGPDAEEQLRQVRKKAVELEQCVAKIRSQASGYQPIAQGEGEPLPPPRKP